MEYVEQSRGFCGASRSPLKGADVTDVIANDATLISRRADDTAAGVESMGERRSTVIGKRTEKRIRVGPIPARCQVTRTVAFSCVVFPLVGVHLWPEAIP